MNDIYHPKDKSQEIFGGCQIAFELLSECLSKYCVAIGVL
jgi:hypothetical protein